MNSTLRNDFIGISSFISTFFEKFKIRIIFSVVTFYKKILLGLYVINCNLFMIY